MPTCQHGSHSLEEKTPDKVSGNFYVASFLEKRCQNMDGCLVNFFLIENQNCFFVIVLLEIFGTPPFEKQPLAHI